MDHITQAKYGKWTIHGKDGRHFLCTCECGSRSRILPFDLKTGRSKQCIECSRTARIGVKCLKKTKHGLSDSPTQHVWSDMKRRCMNPDRRGYENYGGRGITVCDRWVFGEDGKSGFECFIADLGERPSTEHQLDRVDNDGNYCKENCRWVHRNEQNYNKRNTFKFVAFGKEFNLQTAEAYAGIPKDVIFQRLYRKFMTPEEAITIPNRPRKRKNSSAS